MESTRIILSPGRMPLLAAGEFSIGEETNVEPSRSIITDPMPPYSPVVIFSRASCSSES